MIAIDYVEIYKAVREANEEADSGVKTHHFNYANTLSTVVLASQFAQVHKRAGGAVMIK